MNKINKVMLMMIAMVAIMLLAVGIDKGYEYYQTKRWEEERVAVYEEARAEIENMQATIETLSKDPEALSAYIEENELNYVDEQVQSPQIEKSEIDETDEEALEERSVSENAGSEDGMSARMFEEEFGSISDNSVSANSISDNEAWEDTVSDNSVSDNSVSDNSISDNSISDNGVSDNEISGKETTDKLVCASYEETVRINKADKEIIANSQIDFSQMKIACLGDSITQAANLMKNEDYAQTNYPYYLGEILGAKEVVNLGIGGSSIGRYWENAFVDRYWEIPSDTDLIIVMGGTNDGFCASASELGSLEEKAEKTFAGDLDELLSGLQANYPDAEIVLVTPPSNVLHDMLKKDRDYLLPQSAIIQMMQQLAAEYGVPVIDLYYTNMLNTHDAAVIHNFMPDGVHGNAAGYRILAEHIAAEVIGLYENMEE